MPLDDARSTPQNRALVTSGNSVGRNSGRLPSAARRRRCAPAAFQPSLRLCSTFPARRPQTEAGCLSAPRHPALLAIPLQQFVCAAKLPNRPATRKCFARVQVPNAQQPNVMRPGQLKGVGNVAQMFKSAGEFYGRPTVELANRRKCGTLGRFFNH